MSIPFVFQGVALQAAYSGKLDTTRYIGVDAEGFGIQIDVIQSLPKGDRWRHVIRCTHTGPASSADVKGIRPYMNATFTFDHPTSYDGAFVRTVFNALVASVESKVDEVASGQQ